MKKKNVLLRDFSKVLLRFLLFALGFAMCYFWLASNKEIKSLDEHCVARCENCGGHIWKDWKHSECVFCLECEQDIK